MPEPTVVRMLREFKERIILQDAAQMAVMARRWLEVERAIGGQMDALATQMAAMKARGETVGASKLYHQDRYRELLRAAKTETAKYAAWAGDLITDRQGVYIQLGLLDSQAALSAIYMDAGVMGNFGILAPEAVDVAIGYASDGTPLNKLLAKSYPSAVEGMSQALIKNVALGRSPEVLAREMRNGFGAGLQESMVLARDQQLRVYRATTDQSYRESGVVVGKRRLAARDARTCLACLAMDGELLDVDEDMYDHPRGRCTTVPVLADMPELEWQQGPQWFDTLPDTEQRAMMGDKLYEGWKADKFSFRDLATQTQHADWGKGLRVTPAGRLLEGGA